VERRLKEALKNDRARIQVGRISAFGLMEMSRQRLRPSLAEASTQPCPHCGGTGFIRSTESTALHVLRAVEEEGARARSAEICVYVPTGVALYLLNQKRDSLAQIEARYGLRVIVGRDDTLIPPNFRIERLRAYAAGEAPPLPRLAPLPPPVELDDEDDEEEDGAETAAQREAEPGEERSRERGDDERGARRRRRRRGPRGEEGREPRRAEKPAPVAVENAEDVTEEPSPVVEGAAAERNGDDRRRRRRGRRGGRWRGRDGEANGGREPTPEGAEDGADAAFDGAEIAPPAPAQDEPISIMAEAESATVAAGAEAAVESAEILPLVEPESEPEPERELEVVAAGDGAAAEADGEPTGHSRRAPPAALEGVDVHAVTEKPVSPRRGWWTRLIQ
jgi:ribonuclease E